MASRPLPEGLAADVAVVGAGPAGIAAAAVAAESGRRVVVLDEQIRPGGQIWRHTSRASLTAPARRWIARLERSGARVVSGAAVVDAAPGIVLTAEVGGEPLAVAAETVILATGARELFLPFPGWTLPNVMGVGGAQALLKAGAEVAGKRVVVAGSGPLLLPVAAALAAAGARLVLVAEQAPRARVLPFAAGLWRSPARVLQAVRYRGGFLRAPYRLGTWVTRAAGDGAVREATLTDGARSWTVACDLLCVGYGLVPSLELARLLGCAVADDRVAVDAAQRTSREGVLCAGEPTGVAGAEAALLEGEVAGLAAAGRGDEAARLLARRDAARAFGARVERAFALRPELRALPDAETVVCRCEDVTLGRLRPEWGARQAKLYTRAGMGPCQGRVCASALRFLRGWDADTVRAPIANARVGTLIHAPPSSSST